MKSPSVLMVGDPRDYQTQHQMAGLESLGARVVVLPPWGAGATTSFTWGKGGVAIDGQRLDEVDAMVVRHLPSEQPSRGVFDRQPGASLTFPRWFQHAGLQRDRFYALFGFLLALENRTEAFNPPSRSNLSRRKPYQLDVMRNLGCPLPDTLITNCPIEAEAFLNRVGAAIAKPAAGGALTLASDALTVDELGAVREAPAIFQRRIYGQDIRVMVLDGEVISSVAIDVPAGTLDFRGDPTYAGGEASYTEVTLPGELRRLCGNVVHTLGLRFAGIDLKRTKGDDFVFLEVNSSPIYMDVELKMGHPITEQFCRRVVARARRRVDARHPQRPTRWDPGTSQRTIAEPCFA